MVYNQNKMIVLIFRKHINGLFTNAYRAAQHWYKFLITRNCIEFKNRNVKKVNLRHGKLRDFVSSKTKWLPDGVRAIANLQKPFHIRRPYTKFPRFFFKDGKHTAKFELIWMVRHLYDE